MCESSNCSFHVDVSLRKLQIMSFVNLNINHHSHRLTHSLITEMNNESNLIDDPRFHH